MILSLSDNQGSKKEVFSRTFSQKLWHSVMLLKCLHLTTTSLWKPTTYYCYISTPPKFNPRTTTFPKGRESSNLQHFQGLYYCSFRRGEGVDTMFAFCFLLFGNTPYISSMATPKAKYPDVQRCWSLCTKAPESGKFEEHSSIRNDPDGLHNHFLQKKSTLIQGTFKQHSDLCCSCFGFPPPKPVENRTMLDSLSPFWAGKTHRFPSRLASGRSRKTSISDEVDQYVWKAQQKDWWICQMFRNAWLVSWEQNGPSTSQFTYNVTRYVFVFEMYSYIFFVFVVSCRWFCCSEK